MIRVVFLSVEGACGCDFPLQLRAPFFAVDSCAHTNTHAHAHAHAHAHIAPPNSEKKLKTFYILSFIDTARLVHA